MTTGRGKQPAKKFKPVEIRAIAESLQEAVDNLNAAAELMDRHGIFDAYLHLTNLQNTLSLAAARFAREAKGDVDDEIKAKQSGTISPREKSVLRYQREKTPDAKPIDKPKRKGAS